ncbi:MAG: GNAT family N-acetyltransferase [Methanocorpusculum sp.]|nr:GNAT family N-acetyltransferase [Methanocorpusculum sp.]MDE2523071.1 GNAT family N-acetyltransferase [Methanocorpusculum sp.]MDE2523904.1 GNAT family N-acetyltransferase [Methanocorpusculum sp.]
MDLLRLTKDNLAAEHICCAISHNNDCQVAAKKSWLGDRLDEGLVFLKGNVRGKCFIEYIPAEAAWAPVTADGYMYINCLWVAGQYAGRGYATRLLEACIADSKEKGKHGLVMLAGDKKRPFLADPKFLRHKGFTAADTAAPYYELYYLPFDSSAPKPQFTTSAKQPHIDEQGFVLYYSHQCPFTAKYVPLIEKTAQERGVSFRTVQFTSAAEAQNAPAPFTSYSLFYDGEFVTNEILSEKKFAKILSEHGL